MVAVEEADNDAVVLPLPSVRLPLLGALLLSEAIDAICCELVVLE